MDTSSQIRISCVKEMKQLLNHSSPTCRLQKCNIVECKTSPLDRSNKNLIFHASNKSRSVPNKLSIIQLNIQSLKNRNHLLQLRELIRAKKYHIITLSETWLNESVKNAEVEIEGYKIFRLDRKGKRCGGVCAYIRTPLKVHILKDLSGTSTNWFQQLWLQVQYRKIKSFVICVAYRPPDCHISSFEDNLIEDNLR